MTQLILNVEHAASDAAAALLRAEQNREAALSAVRAADADLDEAREVLERLRRLHALLAARDDEHAGRTGHGGSAAVRPMSLCDPQLSQPVLLVHAEQVMVGRPCRYAAAALSNCR